MELVGGESLRDRIRRGPLPIAEALAIARDTAGALALAHRRGIAHRDVKPENLMFDEDGAIKLMDFGLARVVAAARITMTGSTLGTAAYMAPESTRGATGPPADVFALGVVLHEMLAGGLPFAGDSPLALMYVIANEPPKPVRDARPDVPDAVAALIARMLEKDPDARLDATTIARELAVLTDAPLPPAPGDTVELEAVPVGSPERALAPTMDARRPRRAAPWILGFGLLLAVVAGLVPLAPRRGGSHPPAETAIALNNRGYDRMRHDSLGAARADFEAALHQDGHYEPAMLNLATLLRQTGDPSRATALYDSVLGEHPRDPKLAAGAHDGLAEVAMSDAAYASAIDHYRSAMALDSANAGYANNFAYALIQAGRTDEADAALRVALRRFPGVAALYKNAALIEFTRGHYMRTLGIVNQGLALDRTMAAGWSIRARAEARLGRLTDARADRDRFAALDTTRAARGEIDAEIAAAPKRPQ
ncbi:MAG: protein kinase [Candidatus Eisenbacteria bacterium]|uniref:Protein kinase n=1 Tax=Eiseniibacteriota bacterium TaxID=2212470 RepID=A0A9D6QKI9_UNCEI|nr:protein kinase [Candidatus Eisenbacteria bacterium]